MIFSGCCHGCDRFCSAGDERGRSSPVQPTHPIDTDSYLLTVRFCFVSCLLRCYASLNDFAFRLCFYPCAGARALAHSSALLV